MAGRRVNGSGSVYRDAARGTWMGEVVLDGKRRRVSAPNKVDCSAKLARLIADDERGVGAIGGNTTVGELLELWRTRELPNRDASPGTLENYGWSLRTVAAEFGKVRLRSLDVERVERGIDHIATGVFGDGRPLSRRTLKGHRSTLAQALDFGMKRKMIASNPARLAVLTPTATKPKPRRSLTPDEARTLWAALEGERIGNYAKLLLTTGMRPGEGLGLCWDAVDLDAGLIVVRRSVRLEGNRARLVDSLKTDGSFRTLRLPAPAIAVLRAQRAAVAEMKLAARVWATNDAELVFPTVLGTPWNISNLRDELADICARAGLHRVLPNELRHSAASLLVDAGVPVEQVADLLGHEDFTMLATTYRHRLRPAVDAAVATMDKLFGS